jgi:sporulation protein YlmC with PRC-barrel domain
MDCSGTDFEVPIFGIRRERRFGAMRLSDENLQGRTVIAAEGQAIGESAAFFLDSDSWRIESLQVKLHNEVADQLGAKRGMFYAGTLEMPIRMVRSVGAAVVLSVTAPELLEGARDSQSLWWIAQI